GVTVPPELHAGLTRTRDELARARGASMFMVLHAALAALLARLSGSDDIAIGTPIAGRGEQALDDLVGMFVNTLVLRTAVESGETFAEDRKSTRLNSSHVKISYAVFCLICRPPASPVVPYTTLFRSLDVHGAARGAGSTAGPPLR